MSLQYIKIFDGRLFYALWTVPIYFLQTNFYHFVLFFVILDNFLFVR